MQKLLFKRTLRVLKANAFRYLALFLLIILALFMIIGTVGSAQSIIRTVDEKADANHLEDGQFHVFYPLKEENLQTLHDMGITLEECFYLDFQMEDESTLRLMKNRTKINTLELAEGTAATADDEIVLERIYAAAHDIKEGETITVAGKLYTVTGIGTSADYDNCLQNMSDVSSDGKSFGTAFVTDKAYETLLNNGSSLHTEEYCYSYLLGNGSTHTDLKDYLLELKVYPDEIEDPLFQEMLQNELQDRDELTDGLQELATGSAEISHALDTLAEGSTTMENGISAVYEGLTQLNDKSNDLTGGSNQVLSALTALESALGNMDSQASSVSQLRDASAGLLAGLQQLNIGLQQLPEQVNYQAFEAILAYNGADLSSLSPDAQLLLNAMQQYLTEVNTYLCEAASGSQTLYTNFQSFDQAIDALPTALEEIGMALDQLSEAISALHTEYEKLDSGIISYTDGVRQLYNGYEQINNGAKDLSQGADELSKNAGDFRTGTEKLQTETDKVLDEYFPVEVQNLTSLIEAEDNPRIKASNNDKAVDIKVGLWAGIIVFILITYVISVFVIHSIDQESTMIGALYALGLKPKQLMLHYTLLPVLLCLAGGIVGTLIGYSDFTISLLSGDAYDYFSTPVIETFYSPWLLFYGLVIPPLIAFIVNWIIIRKRLSRSALSLLRKEPAQKKANRLRLTRLSFVQTFQIRQFLREKRSCFAVLAGMFISLLILTLGLNCFALCLNIKEQNTEDTKYTYMYQYKYPTSKVPEGGYAAYAEGLNKEVLGYNMEISVIGLSKDNPFFPAITSERKNEISISNSVATKYDLSVGDKLILSDQVDEREYGFTVKEIVAYSSGMCCFMDVDSMRTLFEQDDDYYNVVYSDHALDIDNGRLYGVSTKADIVKSADIFMEMMLPMMSMLTGISIILFLIVMYQMMKVMIDRSSLNISLMKIFGYRDKEVRRLYLDSNSLLIAAGAMVLIPVSKLIMDALYPGLIANVACGIDMGWPPVLYVIVYILIICCYLLIRTVLMQKLKRVMPAEMLKDRE